MSFAPKNRCNIDVYYLKAGESYNKGITNGNRLAVTRTDLSSEIENPLLSPLLPPLLPLIIPKIVSHACLTSRGSR